MNMLTKDFVVWLKNENEIIEKLNFHRNLLKKIRKKIKVGDISKKMKKELEMEIKYLKSEISERLENSYLEYFEI